MKNIVCTLIVCVGLNAKLSAQSEPVSVLDAVHLQFVKLKDSTYTKNVTILSDSVLQQNQASLTNLLQFNSTVYFKENGLGMVSSPSFRGTTASQTSVLWNGIPINSQTTGQTDFNTINIRGFDKVAINPGGSSVENGNGAIGGTINLINDLPFNEGFQNQIFANYGEFNTYGFSYRTGFSNKNLSLNAGVARNGSDNNYPYPGTNRNNINGQYYNTDVNLAAGLKVTKKNTLRIFANMYDGRRNFSVPTPNALRTKYTDFNTRALVEWEYHHKKIHSNLKVANVTEEYRYFGNINNDFYTFGNVTNLISQYRFNYVLNKKLLVTGGLHYMHNSGQGSNIQSKTRNSGAANLSFKHHISETFLYEIGLRQEIYEDFESPLLYSAGVRLTVTDYYQLKINTSKNFRIPTFNNLYWTGSGNPDLRPETSYQAELSNCFSLKNTTLAATAYYNKVTNLLQYVPDTDGIFRPQNTSNVNIYGAEGIFKWQKKINAHQFNASATYAYTVSENEATGNQLIYVPFHKFTSSAGYGYNNISGYYQYVNNGEVFTTTDNNSGNILDSYMVANLGLDYTFGSDQNYKIGVQILNLWDEEYESVLNRPMPGRNFNGYLNLNF